jgi:hypothetical protein
MNVTKKVFIFLFAIMLMSCNAYKAKKQEALLTLPELGTVVKTKGGLLYSATESIGIPKWKNLKVDIQELPFNLDSYVAYSKHMQSAGKVNTIPYNDSLRFKPKYIRLQLPNKIAITTLLNNENNRAIRDYISLDKDYKLVMAIDVAFTENEIATLNNATGVHLAQDKLGNLVLELNTTNSKQAYLVKDLPSFKYTLSSFCWGEDRYHNLRVENLVAQGDGCPKNTYQKASKIKSNREYLKF